MIFDLSAFKEAKREWGTNDICKVKFKKNKGEVNKVNQEKMSLPWEKC